MKSLRASYMACDHTLDATWAALEVDAANCRGRLRRAIRVPYHKHITYRAMLDVRAACHLVNAERLDEYVGDPESDNVIDLIEEELDPWT